MVRTAATSLALMIAAIATATGAALIGAPASNAQPTSDFAPACSDEALDALTARGCRARALGAAEDELNVLLNALRGSARVIDAAERRRSALANIDAAHNAWRLLRDHDCGLDAALAPGDIDAGTVQINCAIGQTRARTARLAVFLADAPVTPNEATTTTPASAVSHAGLMDFTTDADVQHFRDWRASCRADGSCTVFTMTRSSDAPGAPDATGAAHVFRLERPRRNAGWNVHLIAPPKIGQPGMAAPEALDPSRALTVRVDRLAPEVFQPGFDFTADGSAVDLTFRAPMKTARVFEGMRAGLALEVGYTDTSAQSHTDSFSLRGLSSALSWVEGHQPVPDTTANAG